MTHITTSLFAALGLTMLLSGCIPAGEPQTEIFNADTENISKIDIDLSTSNLRIKTVEQQDLYMEFETFENGPVLKVREGRSIRIDEETNYPFPITYDRSPLLTLYLPADYDNPLIINTSSGDVDADKLNLSELNIHVSSGDIFIFESNTDDMVLELSSGDVILEDVNTDYLTIKTSSGDAELINVTGEITGRSSSGKVWVEMEELRKDFSYNISSGDFSMNIEESPENADFNLSCSSGDIDLDIQLDNYDSQEDNRIRGSIGDASIDVEVHTSSGDIEIGTGK